jgi:hypothetical protein
VQFERDIMPPLDRLANEGIPIVYVTGDVHWGRVARGFDMRTSRTLLYEIITSPSRLIRVPIVDKGKEFGNAVKGLFGKADAWPRHGSPADVPNRFPGRGRFQLECDPAHGFGYQRRGDQIAIMSFCRAGGGVNFRVSYYGVTTEKILGRSSTTPTFKLRIL